MYVHTYIFYQNKHNFYITVKQTHRQKCFRPTKNYYKKIKETLYQKDVIYIIYKIK